MLIRSLAFKAAVSQNCFEVSKYNYGTCEKTFKERYSSYTATFRNRNKQKTTELSKYIWKLRAILKQINTASKSSPLQSLHTELRSISDGEIRENKGTSSSLLGTGDEIISKCKHKNKFTLKCSKTSHWSSRFHNERITQ